MTIKQLAHICLHVRDIDKTVDFYARILGMPVKFRFIKKADKSVKGAYFEAGNGTYVEFFITDKDKSGESPVKHMCLEVDSIDQTIADIRERGGEVSDKKLGSDQSWQAWTTDPDGVRIELHEYTENSSQITGCDTVVDW